MIKKRKNYIKYFNNKTDFIINLVIGCNLGSTCTYKAICIVNVILCVVGCICQVIAIFCFEMDAVGDNKYNGNGYVIGRIIYQEIMYGCF